MATPAPASRAIGTELSRLRWVIEPVEAARAPARTPDPALAEREELVSLRAAGWRLLVPLRHVERVLPAAMPAARPAGEAAAPVVAVDGELLPVVFASALAGGVEVELEPSQQMVLLAARDRRALLWVDAVDDVVAHAPARPPPGAAPGELVLAWSGAERPLAVLDVPRLLSLVTGSSSKGER
jgi:chemotaxis signal transduction protein